MCLFTECEELRLAAYLLVTGTESIQDRLFAAWKFHLEHLKLRDAPEFLQIGLASVRNSLKQVISDKGRVRNFEAEIPDTRAIDLVQKILYLADDVNQVTTRAHYKYIASEFCLGAGDAAKSEARHLDGGGLTQDPGLSALSPQQKLQLAVYSIAAGTEGIQQRFGKAWSEQLRGVEASEFPEYLRKSFVDLEGDVRAVVGEDLQILDNRTVTEDRVQQLVSRLFFLAQRAYDLSIFNRYKHVLRA
jgi:hypothetical protein